MNKHERIQARQRKLQGIDARRLLQRAAQELDAKGKFNARIAEVESRKIDYAASQVTDVYVIHEKTSDGWRAYSCEDIEQQGCLDVRRADRENLEPALRFDLAGKLTRGGRFNIPREAIEYVRDRVRFIVTATFEGKTR